MADKEDSGAGVLAELTPEELKVLSRTLKRIEADIFSKVLKRISVLLGIALSILLIGGVVNLSSCSTNIENSASQKLSSDPELRDKIVSKAQGDFKDTQEKLKALNSQIAELEKANASAAATLSSDLDQIHFMIERINEELLKRLQPRDNQTKARERQP